MIREKSVLERTTDRAGGEYGRVSVNDQVTISSRLIERGLVVPKSTEYIVEQEPSYDRLQDRLPWLPFVYQQLQAIATLPSGWDSNGAPRPEPALVEAAKGLIECLAQVTDLPQPHVNPTRNGGVQFEWEAGPRYFELEIVAERAAEYLFCDDAAQVEETGNVFEDEPLDRVLEYIFRVGDIS